MNADPNGDGSDPDVTAATIAGSRQRAGAPIKGLTAEEQVYFLNGKTVFEKVDAVADGLGPGFNSDSCVSCHAHPASGGSSPPSNPQFIAANRNNAGKTNKMPAFLTPNGPVREVRFPWQPDYKTRDGGVHDLFVITGRSDAGACDLKQPDFETAAAHSNLVFRIPTPVFGLGLIEAIPDATILANMQRDAGHKVNLGIGGRPNTSGNDGTVTRFGWKAQNKSLMIFAGEAYNVEMGVTNEVFPNERNAIPGCVLNPTPEDATNFEATQPATFSNDIIKFATFMRFLDQPAPLRDDAAGHIARGRTLFNEPSVGCALCHTPTMTTGKSPVRALSNVQAHLYSDLLLHRMGPGLADNILQGAAAGDEFRTAPLWGLGQRLFFLHDGRTNDLMHAIQAHKSAASSEFAASEANAVIDRFNALPGKDQQDVLTFLRSL